MVSCTDCVHYNACKTWSEHTDRIADVLNSGFEQLSKLVNISYEKVNHIPFPIVAETPKELCENYLKAKVNVGP